LTADALRDAEGEAVEVRITEKAPRSPLSAVGETLRGFGTDKDLRREAGLMLLKSLSAEDHRTLATQGDGALVVRVIFGAPTKHGAPPAAQRGDVSDCGPDEA
jgi:hypothetical protein